MASKKALFIGCGVFLFLLGAAFFIIGWGAKPLSTSLIKDAVKNLRRLEPSDKSDDPDSRWQRLLLNRDYIDDWYAYNITNPVEFLAGTEAVKYQIVGPYKYTRKVKMYNTSFSSDENFFNHNLYWYFESREGADRGTDQIYTLNIPYLGGMNAGNALTENSEALSGEISLYALKIGPQTWPAVKSQVVTGSSSLANSLPILSLGAYLTQSFIELQDVTKCNIPSNQLRDQFISKAAVPGGVSSCDGRFSGWELEFAFPTPSDVESKLWNTSFTTTSVSLASLPGISRWLQALNLSSPTNTQLVDARGAIAAAYGLDATQLGALLQKVGVWISTKVTNATYASIALTGWTRMIQTQNLDPIRGVDYSAIPNANTIRNALTVASWQDLALLQFGSGLVAFAGSNGIYRSFSQINGATALDTTWVGSEFGSYLFTEDISIVTPDTAAAFTDCDSLTGNQLRACMWINLGLNAAQSKAWMDKLALGSAVDFGTFYGGLLSNYTAFCANLNAGFGIAAKSAKVLSHFSFSRLPYWASGLGTAALQFRAGLVIKRSIREIFTGYTDPLTVFSGVIGGWTSPDDHYSKTVQGLYKLRTGKENNDEANRMYAWRGVDKFSNMSDILVAGNLYGASQCSLIMPHKYTNAQRSNCKIWNDEELVDASSVSSVWVNGDGEETVPTTIPNAVYMTETMRRMDLVYSTDTTFKGINLRRYLLSPRHWLNASFEPSNAKYFMGRQWPDSSINVDTSSRLVSQFYSPQGTIPIGRLNSGAPLYVTKARFMGCDASLYSGLNVKEADGTSATMGVDSLDYDSYVEIEPLLGYGMQSWKRLQVNAWIPKSWIIPSFSSFNPLNQVFNFAPLPRYKNIFNFVNETNVFAARLFVPMLFNYEGNVIADRDANSFKDSVYMVRDAATIIKPTGIVVGGVVMILAVFLIYKGVKLGSANADSISLGETSSTKSLDTSA